MIFKYSKLLFTISFLVFVLKINAQNSSDLYKNWVAAQTNNTTPTLPTFSYAGYKNGEVSLPTSFSQQIYDVTKNPYNAIPNDNKSDKAAIIKAIAAAEKNPNGGIIFFPPGRFIINDASTDNRNQIIKITKSNIVLKGSGSGSGGTELIQKDNTEHRDMATKDWTCPYLIQFTNEEDSANSYITNVTADAERETYSVQVKSTSGITVGQWIELYVKKKSDEFRDSEIAPYKVTDFYEPNKLKISIEGVEVREIHKVVSKTSNTITFKEPLHKKVASKYGWVINNFKALEEVGIQDLKYTGGFVWKHLHHQAPQFDLKGKKTIYNGEAKLGPHAYLSSSGWSGIQFNHVVNGWIKNVEFTQMSQVAQFKFSAYCTAIDNRYTGNPGHNFISTNSATGCFIGRNIDYTKDGIWHGCGVNAVSIANVLWKNKNPIGVESGMEMHASQPRSTLFDLCEGGMFYNQGGSTGAMPNHLKHLVLWNFKGSSYAKTGVRSWNKDSKYHKFIMPIISGLVGFTMSTEANQYLVNESPGKHVKETSLYKSQLEYRLGTLPSWVTGVEINPFYPNFYYEDFRQVNQGYSIYIDQNPNLQDVNQIGKRISDIPDVSDSNNKFTETRPTNRIPVNTERDQKALAIVGTSSNTNYKLETWVVMPTINTSISNPYINKDDTYKYVSFWTQQRYANGGISALEVYISTDYIDDVGAADWTNVTSKVGQIATSGKNPQTYVKSVLDISAYANTNFTLAFRYTSGNSAYSQTNRNGTFYISDVKYFLSSSSLSTSTFNKKDNINVYPNPFSSEIKIGNLEAKFRKAVLFDAVGRVVLSKNIQGLESVNLNASSKNLSTGIYFLKLIGASNTKKYKLIKK